MARGPLALVGSGEFTPAMERVDAGLLDGRPGRAVFLPTAAAPEGNSRLQYWVDLGNTHFRHLGVDVEPILVLTRPDADDEALAAKVAGAGLIYLSGGNPAFLADTLRESLVGAAIRSAWESGAAVAGCSAGAMALAERVPRVRDPGSDSVVGLGFVPDVVVIPHFDRIDQWMPGATDVVVSLAPEGSWVVGIDEDTAVVGAPDAWEVQGRGSTWLMKSGEERREFRPGERFSTLRSERPSR
jgi:cyanophycinase-like exopeptidase